MGLTHLETLPTPYRGLGKTLFDCIGAQARGSFGLYSARCIVVDLSCSSISSCRSTPAGVCFFPRVIFNSLKQSLSYLKLVSNSRALHSWEILETSHT